MSRPLLPELPEPASSSPGRAPALGRLALPALVGAGLLYLYWPALREMVDRWSRDPRYSHGFLVPAFSAYLLWSRRGMLAPEKGPPRASWWGIALLALGEAVRFAGAYFYVGWFQGVALLPSLAGLALLAGGWRTLRWAAPAIAFLFFMIPLPYRIERALGSPLQGIATKASTYLLQTFGLPAVSEGYIILVEDARIGVVEACNGLGMLFTFLAFAFAVALIIERPWVDKALIILSAVPIALAANIARITVTGLLHVTVGGKVADTVYHDLAGWLMMPMALAALWAELYLLSRLLIEPPPAAPAGAALGLLPVHDFPKASASRTRRP